MEGRAAACNVLATSTYNGTFELRELRAKQVEEAGFQRINWPVGVFQQHLPTILFSLCVIPYLTWTNPTTHDRQSLFVRILVENFWHEFNGSRVVCARLLRDGPGIESTVRVVISLSKL